MKLSILAISLAVIFSTGILFAQNENSQGNQEQNIEENKGSNKNQEQGASQRSAPRLTYPTENCQWNQVVL